MPAPPRAAEWAGLAAILAVALALRLKGLDAPLWFDEIVTLETHLRLPWGGMMAAYSMNHHYLYDLAAKAAMDLWGEDPWVLRLPAVAFGVAGIAASWALARRLAPPAAALLAAALLALSYHHIWFSQNARGYTGLALFCTLGLLLFLRGRERPALLTWLAFAATLALAIATHLTGAFLFLALGLVWLARLALGREPGGRTAALTALGFALGLALTLAFYAPLLPSLGASVAGVAETSAVDAMPEYQSPLWTLAETVRSALGTLSPATLLAALAALGLAAAGALAGGRDGRLVAVVTLVHILLTAALLKALGMRIWPRFFFPDIGLILVLVAAGAADVADRLGRALGRPRAAPVLLALGALAMLGASGALASRNWRAPKQDLAGAVARAGEDLRPGERVYAVGQAALVFDTHFHAGWGEIRSDADYAAALAEPGPVTLVIGFPGRSLRAIPAIQADLDGGTLTQLDRLPGTLGDGSVLLLRR